MSQNKTTGALFVSVLASVTLVGPLALHLFFPATPVIKAHFAVGDALADLTLSGPLFVMALFTLIYGSLSDRYGRRPVLLAGILLFVAGSAMSAAADSIWALIAGRLIQGAGGACGLALARAIARDVYGTDRLVKVIAYLTMAYSLGPMVAAPMGGFLIDIAGWRAVLLFASASGLVIALFTYAVIHETHLDRGAKALRVSVFADYRRLLGDIRFSAFVLQSGFCSGAFFAMAAAAAFLMKEYLGRPASEFGLYFLFFPFGYWSGNFVASRLSGRVAIETMVLAGSVVLVLTAAIQAALMTTGYVTPLSIFIPGFLVTFAQGIALPNSQAGAIGAARDRAGTAAGIGVFMQMFLAGVFIQIYGLIADGTPLPMVIAVSTGAVLSLATGIVPFVLARRGKAAGTAMPG